MIIWTPEERGKADRQVVVMVTDFSFTLPEGDPYGLKGAMQMPGTRDNRPEKWQAEELKPWN